MDRYKAEIKWLKEDKDKLKGAYEDTIWMAIRYAHGRPTYAPGMVRESVSAVKQVLPDFKLGEDNTLRPFESEGFKIDYLNDLYE